MPFLPFSNFLPQLNGGVSMVPIVAGAALTIPGLVLFNPQFSAMKH